MSDEVIYVPVRSNTHALFVQKWTVDWKESYWSDIEKFPDTSDGLYDAIVLANNQANTGAKIRVVRRATS